MKFDLFTCLATIPLAFADYSVTLVTESDSSDVNGKGLSTRHEGAGFNYLFFGDNAENLVYSEEAKTIYKEVTVQGSSGTEIDNYNLTVFPNTNKVSVSVVGGEPITVEDRYLTLNGSTTFYAGKNTGDPYSISKEVYELLASEVTGALPVKVKVT